MAMTKLVVLLAALVATVDGCIYEYGSRNEANAQAGAHFTYAYNGLDWGDSFQACKGTKQSPIMLPASGASGLALPAAAAKSSFSYGTLTNTTIVNNGHTLLVSLPATFQSDVSVPIRGDRQTARPTSIIAGTGDVTGRVKATPAQFHFHTRSEHIISGAEYAMELHIVHFVKKDQLPACGDAGCPVVLGVMIGLTDNDAQVNKPLRRIIEAMPLEETQSNTIPGTINVDALLPENRTYLTYEGSLTTPPCSEGLLWHVMLQPIKINTALLTRYMEAVGDSNCPSSGSDKSHNGSEATASYNPAGPPKNADNCQKLANGHNWRITQPRNNRTIQLAAY